MELIRKEDPKLMMSKYVGKGTEKSESGEELAYEFRVTMHYAPIIEFPNGDIVVMNWEDITRMAKDYKAKCDKEMSDNESIQDK